MVEAQVHGCKDIDEYHSSHQCVLGSADVGGDVDLYSWIAQGVARPSSQTHKLVKISESKFALLIGKTIGFNWSTEFSPKRFAMEARVLKESKEPSKKNGSGKKNNCRPKQAQIEAEKEEHKLDIEKGSCFFCKEARHCFYKCPQRKKKVVREAKDETKGKEGKRQDLPWF